MAELDAPLTIADVNAERLVNGRWQREVRDWAIHRPMDKLREKYSQGTSLIFSHYVFEYPHHAHDNITPVDIAAVDRLMGGNLSAQRTRWTSAHAPTMLKRVRTALAKIPRDADITNPAHDEALLDAINVITAVPGLKLAIATKLLCIKRPFLVPMMDSVVQICFDSTEPAEILNGFRRLLATPCVQAIVDNLRRVVFDEFALRVSPVRLVDELIWFDWNLSGAADARGLHRVVGFPNWAYNPTRDDLGVHFQGE